MLDVNDSTFVFIHSCRYRKLKAVGSDSLAVLVRCEEPDEKSENVQLFVSDFRLSSEFRVVLDGCC